MEEQDSFVAEVARMKIIDSSGHQNFDEISFYH
jgi:hypothetical protein